MSGHIGQRLFANLWKRASSPLVFSFDSQACSRYFRSASSSSSSTANNAQNAIRNALKGGAWIRRISSSAPKNAKQTARRFASGGFLVLGTSPSSTATVESGAASCQITAVEKIVCHSAPAACFECFDRWGVRSMAQTAWKRNIHTSGPNGNSERNEPPTEQKHATAETSTSGHHQSPEPSRRKAEHQPMSAQSVKNGSEPPISFSHNFMDRLPQIHKPTKEELLAAATGFWSRLKIRFKWFSIRSVRPFNVDEIGAFFSWFLLGHVLWVVLGTTTFFSLLIWAINTVFAQETLARWVGNYLTRSSGVRVVFESAIVPKWRDGVITFKNVFVSRRPGQGTGQVSKGSSKTAAATAAAALRDKADSNTTQQNQGDGEVEDDGNYTQFDLSIDTVNVTLSFTKWFNGKGLLRDVEVKGIRGVVDRTQVHWSEEDCSRDPKSYRHVHQPGDFEIDSFKMEDVLVTVYQPNGFRPFSVSIFSCDLPQLRRQWLFYDFLSANVMSGSYDNSLFTIHPRQTHRYTGEQLNNGILENGKPNPWKKHSRIRIDGLSIDHLNRGVEGPFSWIREGNVDIIADIMFPAEDDESIAKVMSTFYDRLEAVVTSNRYQPVTDYDTEDGGVHGGVRPGPQSGKTEEQDRRFVVTDLRINLNNVRAVVPLFTKDLSYINNALIRPIVAYINSRQTFIPIQCRLVKRVRDFDGSWTIFDSGLMDDLSAETYEAFARDVADEQARKRRLKKVGLWSLQLAAQAIFIGMAGNVI
ncbi:hypothetical protein VTO42DRAFT_321 [Malbranchea cinnamomea]